MKVSDESARNFYLEETIKSGWIMGSEVFYGCTELRTAIIDDIPYTYESDGITSSMVRTGDNVFAGCTALEKVEYKGTAADWGKLMANTTNPELDSVKVEYAE